MKNIPLAPIFHKIVEQWNYPPLLPIPPQKVHISTEINLELIMDQSPAPINES